MLNEGTEGDKAQPTEGTAGCLTNFLFLPPAI